MNHLSTSYLLRTYVLTYIHTIIFEGSYPPLKVIKQKMSEIPNSMFIFFYLAEILKMTKLGQKKNDFGT